MDHPSPSHIAHLLLKGVSIGTVSALTHPITYPIRYIYVSSPTIHCARVIIQSPHHYISAAALLCQANVIQTTDVYKIIMYAFSKARYIKLFRGKLVIIFIILFIFRITLISPHNVNIIYYK